MARSTAMRVPPDEDLTWWLMHGEAILGRSSTFREGGGGCHGKDYERKVTDKRFCFTGEGAEVERARVAGRRWYALEKRHRDVLALAYGVAESTLRAQIVEAANLEAWQAMERSFGGLAGVALYLTPDVSASVRRRRPDDVGGPWRTPRALALFALCLGKDKQTCEPQCAGEGDDLGCAQARVSQALGTALAAWWGIDAKAVA